MRLRTLTPASGPRTESLLDFVPRVSPWLESPVWFTPYTKELERAVVPGGDGVCVVFAAPPQHGKTELTLRAFLWWDEHCPGRRHVYVTYNQTRADEVGRDFQRIAEQAGAQPTGPMSAIRLRNGTTVRFTSVNGSLTGFAVDGVCVIDDPIKDAVDAQSPTIRKRVVDFFDAVAWARRHPGTSFVVMATRWHPDDLSGVLVKRGWPYINLKAIAEGAVNDDGAVATDPLGRKPGESLWHRKPPSFFDAARKNAYWWAALYQGEPRPRGGAVFSEPTYYSELPASHRGAYGLDLAYTAKTHADWSICVELWREPPATKGAPARFYVVDVQRKQVDATSFALTLKAVHTRRPHRMRWYAAGAEQGIADFLRDKDRGRLPIVSPPPRGDKFVRATPVAAAWNAGRILLPEPDAFDAPWLADFLDVVQNFTGVNDDHDDDVDALAAAFDEVAVVGEDTAGTVTKLIESMPKARF
jgi:predicted phage terminase large subunit-like protein